MSLWVCDPDRGGCTTRYSVGAPRCPHCGKTAAYELGDEQRRNVRDVRDTDAEQEADQPAEPPAGDTATAAAEETAGAPAARPARASRTRRARG
jgi:predicted  nucleic acid-binding Zn-ribbon protein